ncbi:uncharacterized protein LOC108298442 [Cebus imitator]|uniref:uncharacterized protein LOC108298442 n=1 Tax=Cebus imitator TaxID=2715852 RepID=UPI00189A623D|nr:uncharacterized protein LOC108298442 [Cebus imitator]
MGRKRASGRRGQSFERVYLKTLQEESARNSRISSKAANICRREREAEQAAPPSPSRRSPGAGLGGPGRAVKDRRGTGNLRGWGAESDTKGQKLEPGPRPPRVGTGGGEVPSHSSSINLAGLRSVNKIGVKRPLSL